MFYGAPWLMWVGFWISVGMAIGAGVVIGLGMLIGGMARHRQQVRQDNDD